MPSGKLCRDQGVAWINGADAQQGLIIGGLQEVQGEVADGVTGEVPTVQDQRWHFGCVPAMAVVAVQQAMKVAAFGPLQHLKVTCCTSGVQMLTARPGLQNVGDIQQTVVSHFGL